MCCSLPARARGLLAVLLIGVVAGCGAPRIDGHRADEERRTCASLRERVTARALVDRGLFESAAPTVGDKVDPLGPAAFRQDPIAWYAALEEAVAAARFGPSDEPSSTSPASRLVDTCRDLDP